jgi:hypothetical protein
MQRRRAGAADADRSALIVDLALLTVLFDGVGAFVELSPEIASIRASDACGHSAAGNFQRQSSRRIYLRADWIAIILALPALAGNG